MASSADSGQISFNPSWMQVSSLKTSRANGGHRLTIEDEECGSNEMVEPIFAKNRYGREDILALAGKDTKPPDGLIKCPFFTEKPLTPIILTSLNETEQRLQQNINSSKALSAAHRSEWSGKDNSETFGTNGSQSNNAWTVAGGSRTNSSFRSGSNRWASFGNEPGTRGGKTSGYGRNAFGQNANPEKKLNKSTGWIDGSSFRRTSRNSGEDEIDPHEATPEPWHSVNDWRGLADSKSDRIQSREPVRSKLETEENAPFFNDTAWKSPDDEVLHRNGSDGTHKVEDISEREKFGPFADVGTASVDSGQISRDSSAYHTVSDKWFYLDPQGLRRGPFDTDSMHAWFMGGYFRADLNIMPPGESTYTPLGELIRTNGPLTPFTMKTHEKKVGLSKSDITNVWETRQASATTTQPAKMDPFANPVEVQSLSVLKEKERLIAEEERKLHEKKKIMLQEEIAKERRMQELQLELQRQREDIEKRALEQEKELELRRLQVLELERQQREKLDKIEEERKLQMAQEESNRRRLLELDYARQEQERQRQLMEDELRRKEEQRIREEQEIMIRQGEAVRRQLEEMRSADEVDIFQRDQEAVVAAYSQHLTSTKSSSKVAPWVTVSKGSKTTELREIQEQERLQLLEVRRREDEERAKVETVSKKAGWSSTAQTSANPWNMPKNAPKPVPIPPAKETQRIAERRKTNKEKKTEVNNADPLMAWVVHRIRQLNPTIDPEVFATFLQDIDSPNEVEDYIITYFGENKSAKEFHQEFLAKRIELRPRRQRLADKEDDLSGPAAAATNIAGNGAAAPSVNNTASTKSGKKLKKGKKVVDGVVLGFRPAGDPNRFNAGEIDNTPPVPQRRR